MRTLRLVASFVVGVSFVGCGGGGPVPDGGADLGGDAASDLGGMDLGGTDSSVDMPGIVCVNDMQCMDDGVYCNGVPRCMPGALGANAFGCLTASPCAASATCDEASRTCLSTTCTDADGDGHLPPECGGDDCDDTDPLRYPGNTEVCDAVGHDDDCNPATLGPDHDGDGFPASTCCNRQPTGAVVCGLDCDDTSMDVSPSAPEVCDGLDDNCNGMIDEGVRLTFYRDADGDSFGDTTMTRMGCTLLSGYTFTPGDCNDLAPAVNPAAPDGPTTNCNGVDDNCDGTADVGCICAAGDTQVCGAPDPIAGGFLTVGVCHPGTSTCSSGTFGPCIGNVDPSPEVCNGLDDDCDGTVDDGVQTTYYADADADGYGVATMTVLACSPPAGYALVPGDCDDTRPLVHQGATESCNGLDDDCNGMIDDGVLHPYYRDADMDGFGVLTMSVSACSAPTGYAATPGDCDDTMAGVHPGVTDICNGLDDDCNGITDPGCACTTGATQMCGAFAMMTPVGPCHAGTQTCAAGAWGSCLGSVDPVMETCNGVDDDCDGVVDDGVIPNWYQDCDGDGYGATGSTPMSRCTVPPTPPACGIGAAGWAMTATDCNDGVATTHPTAPETCNGVDDDCNLVIDDATSTTPMCSAAAPAHEVGTCPAGTCVDVCASGYLDCNATAGCETTQTPTNCGACGHSCRHPLCTLGVCTNDFVQVEVGNLFACARRAGGEVDCWGKNSVGQLGDGTTTERHTPAPVTGITDAVWVAAGDSFACAVHATGTVSCWGDNSFNQLGDGSGVTRSLTPTTVASVTGATWVDCGGFHACGGGATGSGKCWGGNSQGQLGDGTTLVRMLPVSVSMVQGGPLKVALGFEFTCSGLYCWGDNTHGQIGDGTTTERHAPTRWTPSGTFTLYSLTSSSQSDHVCAHGTVFNANTLQCWGAGGAGQIGDGMMVDRHTPTIVPAIASVYWGRQYATGADFTCADRNGAAGVFCWGGNANGDLGDGTLVGHAAPAMLAGSAYSTYDQLAGDANEGCYLRTQRISCWGDNFRGEIGDGTTTDALMWTYVTDP